MSHACLICTDLGNNGLFPLDLLLECVVISALLQLRTALLACERSHGVPLEHLEGIPVIKNDLIFHEEHWQNLSV
jgi:hypothetical protein